MPVRPVAFVLPFSLGLRPHWPQYRGQRNISSFASMNSARPTGLAWDQIGREITVYIWDAADITFNLLHRRALVVRAAELTCKNATFVSIDCKDR